jgi:hypothetical protein
VAGIGISFGLLTADSGGSIEMMFKRPYFTDAISVSFGMAIWIHSLAGLN